ncbi:hypothetical protein SO802_013896 [Lithocarpus litseifolius]|uniref:Uncharacterized protein n=1 Tax=Lithocarpus litseifolius TaxID=425828 RepID=A0AAW2DAL0_9ROSI
MPTSDSQKGKPKAIQSGLVPLVSDDFRAEIFIILSWLLWNRRNCLRLGLQSIPLNQIVQKAGGLLQDFLNAQDSKPISTQLPTSMQWRPPEPNQYKANFDGCRFQEHKFCRYWRGDTRCCHRVGYYRPISTSATVCGREIRIDRAPMAAPRITTPIEFC